MEVKNKVKVLGRGCVIIVEPNCEIHLSDKIRCGENEFEIIGIEGISFMKTVGLLLRPNDIADNTISVGDEIEIWNTKTR